MATNPYISQKHRPEQNLYEDILIEAIKFYGQDIYYLPREIVEREEIFLDSIQSQFSDAYKVEVYIENTDSFDGEGDLFTKFGIELRDQATFVVARKRWKNLIGDYLEAQKFRPREGDLLFLPMSESIFQIMKVETESPFYQLSQLPTFRLQCELFEYSDEDFDTGIDNVDIVEQESAFKYQIIMEQLIASTAVLTSEIDDEGKVIDLNVISAGKGYTSVPLATLTLPDEDVAVFGRTSLDVERGRGEEGLYSQTGANGSIEFFSISNQFPTVGNQNIWFVSGGNGTGAESMLLFGYNSDGYIGYSTYDMQGSTDIVLTAAQVNLNVWQHIAFFVEGTVIKIYVNGMLKDTLTTASNTIFTSEGFAIGANAARTIEGIEWGNHKGHIDEYRAQIGNFATLLTPRLDIPAVAFTSAAAFTVPTEEFVSDDKTVYLNHWNGNIAEVTLEIDGGKISGGVIQEQGYLYNHAPIVTVTSPASGGVFTDGQTVTQVNSTYTMKGEVTTWNSDTRTLTVSHNGATDGKYHEWSTDSMITADGVSWVPLSISEIQDIQVESQNEVFSDFSADFLDFSESNPFGDPI